MIFALFVFYLIFLAFYAFYYDKLLCHKYRFARVEWESNGCPRGFLFNPDEGSVFGFWMNSFKTFNSLSSWERDCPMAKQLIKKLWVLRFFIIIYSIMFVPLMIIFS